MSPHDHEQVKELTDADVTMAGVDPNVGRINCRRHMGGRNPVHDEIARIIAGRTMAGSDSISGPNPQK